MTLCSECSAVVKPVVAIDIDGTLGDYHTHFFKFASLYLGQHDGYLDAKNYDGTTRLRDWFCEITGVTEETWGDIKLAYRQGAQKRSMPVNRGASTLTRMLRAEGAEVWLTTTRPYMRLDNVDPDTRFWLGRNQIEYDYMLYDKNKYNVLAGQVDTGRVVAVLDDLGYQYDLAVREFGVEVPILCKSKHNRAVKRPNEVWDLGLAYAAISDRIDRSRIEGAIT